MGGVACWAGRMLAPWLDGATKAAADRPSLAVLNRQQSSAVMTCCAVPLPPLLSRAGIDMAAAKQHLDFVNLMTYDYHGSWDTTTNFMAPWSDPAVSELAQ